MNINRYFSDNSSVVFWHLPVYYDLRYNINNPYSYPINFSKKLEYKAIFDRDGIPLLDYKGDIGVRYNPCAIAQYALGHLSAYHTKPDIIHEKILKLSDWLVTNLQESQQYLGLYSWYYDFDLDAYDMKSPWNSAIAQGQGLSVLARVYKIFGKDEYRAAALKAFTPFRFSVQNGGLQRIIDGKYICFEEVPTMDRISCVLDGFIYALIGLKDTSVFLNHKEAESLWIEGIQCLQYILPQFDTGYWSKGDIYSKDNIMLASVFYHKLHIAQLKYLYDLTGYTIFNDYANRWDSYYHKKYNVLKAYINKAYFKLFHY